MRAAGSLDISETIKKHEEEKKELEKLAPKPEKRELHKSKDMKPEWIAGFLLLILLLQGFVLFEPHNLDSVGRKVEDIYWNNIQTAVNQRVANGYPDVSQGEKLRIAQQKYLEARSDEKNIKALGDMVESTKDVYRQDGYVYPELDAYDELVELKDYRSEIGGNWFSTLLDIWYTITKPLTSNLNGNLALFSITLGLLCVLLVHRIGVLLYGDYGAIVGAFTFGLLPQFFRQFHAGNIDANGVVLLWILVGIGSGITAYQKKNYIWGIVSLWAIALAGVLWTGYFNVLEALLISLITGYIASLLIPRLGVLIHGFGLANSYRNLAAMLIVLWLIGYLLFGTYQIAAQYTPTVDDSIITTSKWIDNNLNHAVVLTTSSQWKEVFKYYAEREVVVGDMKSISGDNIIATQEDLDVLKKGNVEPGITECVVKFNATYCGKYVIRGNEATANGKHPAVFKNFMANNTIEYTDGNEEALVVLEGDKIYAFVVHKDYANHILTRMMGRDKNIEGYEYRFSTDFPRQINVYTKSEPLEQ